MVRKKRGLTWSPKASLGGACGSRQFKEAEVSSAGCTSGVWGEEAKATRGREPGTAGAVSQTERPQGCGWL